MKAAFVLFISLCFLLLKGHDGIAAASNHSSSHASVQRLEKGRSLRLGETNLGVAEIRHNSLTEKKEDFIGVEDEDEEPLIGRKPMLQAKYFIILTWASGLFFCCNYFKNRLPFCKHLSYTSSYTYLLQRVLRL